jgi:hypothetical protein
MKRNILLIICAVISLQCYGQSQVKIEDEDFTKFINKIPGTKIPVKCKIPGNANCFRSKHSPAYIILLEEAKKYLGYSDKDYYVTEYDYNVDEDRKFNIRQVEHAPFADNKILKKKYIGLLYYRSSSRDIDKCDTLTEVLSTFTLSGTFIDKITIQGHYTREFDWIDFVFLSDDTFKIFHYKPNLENYNIKGGAYYVIDEKGTQTIVEISDYQIDETGKINLIKTHPKQYLKEFVSFYRSYHENSDDPMNEYD